MPRITLNFHPDRRLADGRSVARALLEEGVYRNQFETGISNGLLGGERVAWEDELFAGRYRDAAPHERVKYGGLNVLDLPYGACVGFGSCHLRLHEHVNERATFLYGDSHQTRVGVIGIDGIDRLPEAYIEAHVHGPVSLASDVEAVVIDPAFEGVELLAAASRYGFAAEWHRGLVLPLDAIPTTAPGDEWEWQALCADGRARRLAESLTGGGPLDASHLGAVGETERKYLWRLLVAYGVTPPARARPPARGAS